jgi:hypothetical protein
MLTLNYQHYHYIQSNLIIIIIIMNSEGLNIVPVLSPQGKVGDSIFSLGIVLFLPHFGLYFSACFGILKCPF